MNIGLYGYGKMGKEIESIAIERGHDVVLKINRDNFNSITTKDLQQADVIIEFSTPTSVLKNIQFCLNANIPVVVGTTGWNDHIQEVKNWCDSLNGSMFYASNFSLGVAIFSKVNQYLAEIMNNYLAYDVSMTEIHHIHKLDKPSGTAISLANQILEKIDRKKKWSITEKSEESLFIEDIREGMVPGTHVVKYTSSIDDIEIMHKAHNRKGFALGAVIAAEFIQNKKGIYTMRDLIS
jgi:4-hydroxy-tetrahydrodipicolinate reductase